MLLTTGPNAGKVLVAGGQGAGVFLVPAAEIYDPATGTWSPTGSMAIAREGTSATRLPDGRVLVAGGTTDVSGGVPTPSAESFGLL